MRGIGGISFMKMCTTLVRAIEVPTQLANMSFVDDFHDLTAEVSL